MRGGRRPAQRKIREKMAVRVRFFANVKQRMGTGEMNIELSPCKRYTVRDILDEVTDSGQKKIYSLPIEGDDAPLKAVRVVLNGKLVHRLDGMENPVRNGDQLDIFPLLAGG
jgi:MoaD family protein